MGKGLISGPISASTFWAVRGPMHGMASATWIAASKEPIRAATSSSNWVNSRSARQCLGNLDGVSIGVARRPILGAVERLQASKRTWKFVL